MTKVLGQRSSGHRIAARLVLILLAVSSASSGATDDGCPPDRLSPEEWERITREHRSELQKTPTAQRLLERYPDFEVNVRIVPARDTILVTEVTELSGSECSIARVWAPEGPLRDAAGSSGPAIEDMWAIHADGTLEKLGREPAYPRFRVHAMDPHVVSNFARECIGDGANDLVDAFVTLSLAPMGGLDTKASKCSPSWHYLRSADDLALLTEDVDELEEARGAFPLWGKRESDFGVVERRCVASTQVVPAWEIWYLVCWEFVLSDEHGIVHAENVHFQKVGP